MAVGDSFAVEVAQQSHHNVLANLAHAMRPSEAAAYRLPYPRGLTAEYLAVDDHLVAKKFPLLNTVSVPSNAIPKSSAMLSGRDCSTPSPTSSQDEAETTGVDLEADVDGVRVLFRRPVTGSES